MNEDVERVARETCPEGPGHKHDPSRNISCDWSLRHTREVISYLAPAPGECLCYGADGVTDQKCPVCVRADVLAEVRAHCVTQRDAIRATYDPSITPYHYYANACDDVLAILDQPLDPVEYLWHGHVEGTAPDVGVLAEVRALLPTDTKRADDYGRLVRAIHAILDGEAGR